jgi:hypothetical protein
MTKGAKSQNLNFDSKNKGSRNYSYDEEEISFKEVKREKNQKKYKNYQNVLKAKDINALLEYEEE